MYMDTRHEFHLMQLSDSFFPSGMFSMSGGLEQLVKVQKIKNWIDVLKFIKEQIEFQVFPCDCTSLLIALKRVKNNDLFSVIEIDKKYYSMKLANETRNSSVRSGKQILNTLIHMKEINETNNFVSEFYKKVELKETPCTYPIALAIAAFYLEIPKKSITRMMLYSYSSSVVSAAIRLGIIQHLDAQKILTLLSPLVDKIILKNGEEKNFQDIWQLTPQTEIYQMNHEQNDSRMFIT